MKNIRIFSGIVFAIIIALTFIFYLKTVEPIKSNLIYIIPGISAVLGFILFVIIQTLNKKAVKLQEEIDFQHKREFAFENNTADVSENEKKLENIINYNAIIDRISEKISKGNKEEYFESLLVGISKELSGVQSVAYIINKEEDIFELVGKYAYYTEDEVKTIKLGEGVSGQVLKDQKILIIDNVPDNYIQVMSGLGNSTPKFLLMYPIVFEENTIAFIEIASFEKFIKNVDIIFEKLSERIVPEIIEFIK